MTRYFYYLNKGYQPPQPPPPGATGACPDHHIVGTPFALCKYSNGSGQVDSATPRQGAPNAERGAFCVRAGGIEFRTVGVLRSWGANRATREQRPSPLAPASETTGLAQSRGIMDTIGIGETQQGLPLPFHPELADVRAPF